METPKITTTNKYGITVCKCCASCKNKCLDNRQRICLAGEGIVPSSHLCEKWVIEKGLDNVGKGGGNIKKKEYLQYAIDTLSEDNEKAFVASKNGKAYTRVSIAYIRHCYQEMHGTIYWTEI